MEAASPVGVATPPAPSNPLASPPSRLRRGKDPMIGILIGGAWIPVTALLLAWMVLRHSPQPGRENATDDAFCCPREAAQLFAVIDRSVAPCSDFFAYVCKNAIAQGYVHKGVAKDILSTISGNIIRGTEFYKSTAAAALHWLYTSCLREIWQPELRFRDATEAVLAIGNTKNPMNPADMLRFVLNARFRFRLNFLFFLAFDGRQSIIIQREHVPIKQLVLQCGGVCPGIVLSVVNAHLRTNYTIAKLIEWEDTLPSGSTSQNPDIVPFEELGNAFGGLNGSLLKAVLRESAIDYDRPDVIVDSKASLSLIQRVWEPSNQPMSSSYVLTAVALNAIVGLQTGSILHAPTTESWTICNAHAYSYQELWRTTLVAALTSTAKNLQLRTVFEATRLALANYDPLRRLMATGGNMAEFEAFVANFSLLLPVDLIIRDVAVPTLDAQGFVRNHFRALSFEYEVAVAKWRRGMPLIWDDLDGEVRDQMLFVNDTTLYVPAPAFGLLSGNTSDPLLADAPVIASRMAALMWHGITYKETWSRETLKAFLLHSKCMTSTTGLLAYHTEDVVMSTVGLHVAAAAVGALSTFSSASPVTADWLDLKPAWSLYRMSKAQFFYGRYAYSRCSAEKHSRLRLNEPLRLSPDFGLAFDCPVDKNAASTIACANVTLDSTDV